MQSPEVGEGSACLSDHREPGWLHRALEMQRQGGGARAGQLLAGVRLLAFVVNEIKTLEALGGGVSLLDRVALALRILWKGKRGRTETKEERSSARGKRRCGQG